jgi:hypothetical protein
MNPENIMLSEEVSQQTSHVIRFHLHKMSRTGKTEESESRLVVA